VFGDGFLWGVAAAAYQIEGAADEDGRGPSVWDTFCAEPGRIAGGDTGAVACDHYHRHAEDVALMRDLGVDSYRFSVSWPRVLPDGGKQVNRAGLDFYDRLVDELVAAGIQPACTLYHWDLPQALQDQGGWLNRDTAHRLADYATVVAERLADRVSMWMPLNEPMVVTLLGHAMGVHAPGQTLGLGALPVAHHQLLGHGLAVRALRAAGATNIGIANNHAPIWPATDGPADLAAAELADGLVNRVFADSILLGAYPEPFGAALPGPVADDLEIIAEPLDWYGINHYNPMRVAAPSPDDPQASVAGFGMVPITEYPLTDFGWPVVPDALRELLVEFHERYGDALPPVYVTENGASFADGPDADGRVADTRRIDYLDGYLGAVAAAIESGVDVRGYFLWSVMDNFEWAEGYGQRFGLVHVDFDTQKRTPKDSFGWYRDMIARHSRA